MNDIRKMLHDLADSLASQLEKKEGEDDGYYDQTNSPLPRNTHNRMVRLGKVPGFKVAGRILVKRSDMHDFIQSHKVNPVLPMDEDDDAIVAAGMKQLGMKRAG